MTDHSDALVFGGFTLHPKQRALYEGERPVKIGGRAFDVLVMLVENAGSVVSPSDLIAKVWHDVVVGEANLRVHIASLRKTLRDGREGRRLIATSVGSGYSFVEQVTRRRATTTVEETGSRVPSLPRLSPMIGREDLEATIAEAVPGKRLVTLVGPGGIGKTSLAVAVAHRIAPAYSDGALFVDLATINTTERIFDAFASALGTRAVSSAGELARSLQERRMLVVLDNCEHLIDAAAEIVAELFEQTPRLHILATSREALRAEGEWVYRVPSLATPGGEATFTAEQALAYSSVELFVERASAGGKPYELRDPDAVSVCEICRRLDGIPLAIELAASRVELLGVAGLKSALQTHLGFALKGPRSAPPRHRTLRAVFEWSYATLSAFEQQTLRALSVFRGPFTLECAAAVAADAAGGAAERSRVLDAVADLVEKSMVTTDPTEGDVRFRMLESSREFGLEQLRGSGELETILRRHATYYLSVCEDAHRQLPTRAANVWIAAYRWRMDDVRAAMSWCFGPSGEAAMGAALTVASITLWLEVSAMEEFRAHVERALAYLREHPSTRAAESEVRLKLALGVMLMHTAGPVPAMTEAIAGGLAIAEQLSPALHMEALGAMWIDGHARADYRQMLEMAERFAPLANASSDPATQLIAARMMAWARHHYARYAEGRQLAERVLAVPPPPRVTYGTQRVDGRVMMHTLIARTLWLTGRPDSALAEIRRGVEAALELRHAGTLCYMLSLGACPVALWSGNTDEARSYAAQLIETASKTSLGFWLLWGRAFERVLQLPSGHGLRARDLGMGASLCDHLVTIRADLLDEPTEARLASGELGWAAPEVQRASAVRLAATGERASAERLLNDALAEATQQGAASWQLRIATSLAELQRDRGAVREARELLTTTMSLFVEGATTPDHRAAAALHAKLSAS
jgi:predicted ATPase/DNA-binding winged helix-turn-helix (wHTH) protein